MRTPIPQVDHTGVAHTSFRAMCKAWGVCHMTAIKRLRAGHSLEVALTSATLRKIVSPRVCSDGIAHPTVQRAAAYHGLSRAAVWWRIVHGAMAPADAISTPVDLRRRPKALRMRECEEILDAWRASYYGRGAA